MNRITPSWLYLGMAASLAAVAIANFVFHSKQAEWISLADKELAYALATGFCLKIAAEYRRQPALRLAWLLLAANAIVSLVRHVLDLSSLEQVPHIHLYRQIAITLALLFLLGGMCGMARAFLGTGLGFRIHRIDVVAVAGVFALVSVILIFHEHLSEAYVPLPASRDIQLFSQVVIAVAAALSVVLHRIILEMGGGKLAIAMRFLVAHIVGRVVLVLTGQILRPYMALHSNWDVLSRLAFDATIWIFALAACYRASMFTAALRQAPAKPEEILALSLDKQWSRI
jgi:hypothetical protein